MKDYFDSIFCINLKHHERRRQTVAMEFDSVGFDIANRLHIVDAIYGSDLPEMKDMIKQGIVANPFVDPGGNLTKNIIGCALSHKEAYKKMLEFGHKTSLIIEDDVTWTKLGLRMIANGGLEAMIEDFKKSDYDIMWLGTCDSDIPVYNDTLNPTGLFEYVRYLPEWAGHAYIIKEGAALALLENNTPIQHPADVNIECSNVKICSPRKSFISQHGGEFERPIENRLRMRFDLSVVKNYEENKQEYMPTTPQIGNGDKIEYTDEPDELFEAYNTLDRNNHFKGRLGLANVSLDLDIDCIKYEDFVTGNGDTITSWASIYFKT